MDGGSSAPRLQPLGRGSSLFTIQFPEIPGTHFIDPGRVKGWVTLGATQWLWSWDPWIGYHGKRRARAELPTLDTAQPMRALSPQSQTQPTSPPPPTAQTELSPGQKGPIAPTGSINKPLRTAKAVTNGNHRNHKQSATEASMKTWSIQWNPFCRLLLGTHY